MVGDNKLSLSNLAILLIFKALFSVDFPQLVHIKSWKNREKVYRKKTKPSSWSVIVIVICLPTGH